MFITEPLAHLGPVLEPVILGQLLHFEGLQLDVFLNAIDDRGLDNPVFEDGDEIGGNDFDVRELLLIGAVCLSSPDSGAQDIPRLKLALLWWPDRVRFLAAKNQRLPSRLEHDVFHASPPFATS